jgi:hypothetical protein
LVLRVAVVGARQKRQGTGPWIAKAFQAANCRVTGIIGTRSDTVEEARIGLSRRFGIDCEGFLSLGELLKKQTIDVLAICSPAHFHREHLQQAAHAGLHVFCEKPLWWTESITADLTELEKQVRSLCQAFEARQRVLDLNTQWPCTLRYFWALYPEIKGMPVKSLKMRLSPVSQGPIMVVDSAPHILSLLQALLGVGTVHSVALHPVPASEFGLGDTEDKSLKFIYRHEGGECDAELILRRCPEQPRPAWYTINGRKAEREIQMPAYTMDFVGGDRRVAADDPLLLRVFDFVRCVQSQGKTNSDAIVSEMVALARLVRSLPDAE